MSSFTWVAIFQVDLWLLIKVEKLKSTENQRTQTSTWNTHHTIQHLQNKVSSLPYSTEQTILFQMNKKKEKHHILTTLQQNEYPKEFIQRIIEKRNRRKDQPRERP